MKSRSVSKSVGNLSSRTRAVTVLSIIAVGLAGAAAVGANIGILDSASGDSVGEEATAGTPSSQVVDVYLPADAGGIQKFAVDAAGTVALIANEAGLKLDEVVPAAGWSWTLVQTAANQMLITFTDGSRTLEFTASTTGDGTITTFVSEPVGGPAAVVGGYDDECEYDDDADEVDHDDEHDDDVEDDECEYEGYADDD